MADLLVSSTAQQTYEVQSGLTKCSTIMDDSAALPGLLRLPNELLSRILLDALQCGQISCLGQWSTPAYGFVLHQGSQSWLGSSETPLRRHPNYASIKGLLFTCKQLHHECLLLLAERFTFTVRINVRDDAPAGANGFQAIHALSPQFRVNIRKLSILISFLSPGGGNEQLWVNAKEKPLMFEKIVENINELLHLLPGVEKMHLIWGMFFGNQGFAMMQELYTRHLWNRLGKDWPRRKVTHAALSIA